MNKLKQGQLSLTKHIGKALAKNLQQAENNKSFQEEKVGLEIESSLQQDLDLLSIIKPWQFSNTSNKL